MTQSSTRNKETAECEVKKPDWRISKMGYKFDFNADIWQLDGSTKLNLKIIKPLEQGTLVGLKKALCRYAEELSGRYTSGIVSIINRYCVDTGESSINVSGLTNWKAMFDAETEYVMGSLRAFLLAWNEWGYPGVDNDVVEYLEEQTFRSKKGGKAVRSACPYSGPFTTNELGALLNWASNAFVLNDICLEQYAFFLALAYTGRRSVQIRSLRACDLVCREDNDGNDYVVKFPRAKQRGVGFRKAFRSVLVNEDLFLVLKNQSENSIRRIESALGVLLPKDVAEQIPVFLDGKRNKKIKDVEHIQHLVTNLPDYLHMNEKCSMNIIRNVSVKSNAKSERTGEYINFTSRRFRYTKGTNLARRGITGVALAAALDHSDTQCIDIYTENTEEMADQIDAIMAPVLAPLAQAFVGKLISSEREALRANDPHSRIKNGKSQNVGNCGTYSFCASGYRSCYTCVSFQAWVDAPHEEVLREILEERERQSEIGVSPDVIRSTDRLLLAVQQVISLCKQEKAGGELGVSDG